MDWSTLGGDVLSKDAVAARAARLKKPVVAIERDMVVEVLADGFVGAVISVESGHMRLEDRRGRSRLFPFGRGYLVEGVEVELTRPAVASAPSRSRTASGSRAVESKARVALPSRIYVEGRHDAELVEKVWGDDLRVEGVVVEYMEGIDDLDAIVAEFAPTAKRRLGVLVDHLVPGSKESRIARAVEGGPNGANVRIVGHPYIDVWAAVRPARLGLEAWPDIPRSIEWKRGILGHLGMPAESQADVAHGWKRILGRVRDWNDLEPALLGRVEELIDFVTEPLRQES